MESNFDVDDIVQIMWPTLKIKGEYHLVKSVDDRGQYGAMVTTEDLRSSRDYRWSIDTPDGYYTGSHTLRLVAKGH